MSVLTFYRAATVLAGPFLGAVLARRARRGKEDPARLGERRGIPGMARPAGPLVWLHGASVGEAASAQALIETLLAGRPELSVLMTTGTVTAAALAGRRLPARALHQYLPLDRPGWVARFLDHWRPDAGVWLESELWPNLILACRARGVPMALVNARISARSEARWARAPGVIAALLGCFDIRLAQSPEDAARLSRLSGGLGFDYLGTLKAAAPAEAPDADALADLRARLGGRPVWLAASTHPGDEALALETDRLLRPRFPDLLSVIALRHPARAEAVAAESGLGAPALLRRGSGVPIGPETAVYLVDTLGEMALFHALAQAVYIAGSRGGHGGHNPLEAAHAGRPVLFGPDMANQRVAAQALLRAGGAREVGDAAELADALVSILGDAEIRHAMGAAARATAQAEAGAVRRVAEALAPILPGTGRAA